MTDAIEPRRIGSPAPAVCRNHHTNGPRGGLQICESGGEKPAPLDGGYLSFATLRLNERRLRGSNGKLMLNSSVLRACLGQLRGRLGDLRACLESPRVSFGGLRVSFARLRVTFGDLRVSFERLRGRLEEPRGRLDDLRERLERLRVRGLSISTGSCEGHDGIAALLVSSRKSRPNYMRSRSSSTRRQG